MIFFSCTRPIRLTGVLCIDSCCFLDEERLGFNGKLEDTKIFMMVQKYLHVRFWFGLIHYSAFSAAKAM